MSSLTDNGLGYTTRHRTGMRPAAIEANLAALGCQSTASTPYHPQTCGKICEDLLAAQRRSGLTPAKV